MRKNNFIIFTTQRTGSTWLQTLLHNPPAVRCYGEMFKPNWKTVSGEILSYFEYSKESYLRNLLNKRAKSLLIKRYFSYFYNKYSESAIGYKLMLNQTNKYLIENINNLDVSIIRLRRKNILRQYISSLISLESGTWHVYEEEKIHKSTIMIDTNYIISKLEQIEKDYGLIKEITKNKRCIEVYYEDLCGERFTQTLQYIYNYLKIDDDIKITSNLIKQNPGHLKSLVENYDEVYKTVNNSKYAFCLESSL